MFIFRRSNCFVTASGIVALCEQLFSAPVEHYDALSEKRQITTDKRLHVVQHLDLATFIFRA
jgi:hypothetical protein